MNAILDHYLFDAFSNASDNIFVYVTDVKKDLTRWSKKSVDYFGLEGEYLYDVKNLWLDYIYPDDRDLYIKDISAVLSGVSAHHNCQYRARNRWGDYVWVECRGSILLDDNGEPSVFAGIMTRLDNQLKYDNLTHLMTAYELQKLDFSKLNGSMLLLGVDNFRNVNSRHGLLYGNKLLVYLSELLVQRVPFPCRIYRFQGDEFVVLAEGRSHQDMIAFFNMIRQLCLETNHDEDITGFSISGGVVRMPEDGNDFQTLISKAEFSVAYAKESAKTHVSLYSGEIEAKQVRRSKVAEALLDSIKNDFRGFELYFQPIVSNENDSIIACESLLRWNPHNDEIGNCFPNEFIPILEANRGIIEVGEFVMRSAIKQASEWQKRGKNISVSFNVSYIQLEDENFIPSLIETAEKYSVDTSKIVVELTESIFAADTVLVQNAFGMLRSHGIKIALDDFGTGNSSFWMLHNMNVDIIKLDQAFIRGLSKSGNETDYAIVESVAYLCEKIHYLTVAEGVENDEVWNRIKKFGFTGLQGYDFSRPIPLHEFEEFMEKYNA